MNIASLASGHHPHAQGGSASITESQTAKLQEILSNFDPESLSTEDAAEIVSQIRDLGIQPGRELAEELKSAGFDPRELREAASVEGQRRPPPPPPSVNEATFNALSEILEGYDLNALSEEDKTNILSSLAEQGVGRSYENKIIDISA